MSNDKITLLTVSSSDNDYWGVFNLSVPNKLEYCLRHRLQLASVIHKNYHPYNNWGERESFILDALDSYNCDWVFFQGADTLVTNMTVDLRQFLSTEFDIIIGVDINGINNDSMFFQNTPKTHEFLKRVINKRTSVANDQVAMGAVMTEMSELRISRVSQRLFNSMKYDEYGYGLYPEGNWQPGDFVIHFAGLLNQRRILLMNEYLNKVIR